MVGGFGDGLTLAIYWIETADLFTDSGDDDTAFMAFDSAVRFLAFHPTEGDEPLATCTGSSSGRKKGCGNGR